MKRAPQRFMYGYQSFSLPLLPSPLLPAMSCRSREASVNSEVLVNYEEELVKLEEQERLMLQLDDRIKEDLLRFG